MSFQIIRNSRYWIEKYEELGALFIHRRQNSSECHPVLRSQKHSNAFFNNDILLQDPSILDVISWDIVSTFRQHGLDVRSIDRVVGPAMGAITVAHDIARHVSARGGRPCFCSFTEKETVDDAHIMVFNRATVRPNEKILIVEDVITTGGSVEKTARAITDAEGVPLPFIACIVNRSGLTSVNGRQIISLVGQEIEEYIQTWSPQECPLCKMGSEAISDPKKNKNWRKLTAK